MTALSNYNARFRLFCINDVYSFLPNSNGLGGYAQLPSCIKSMQQDGIPSYTILAGDFLSGSSIAWQSKGKLIIDILNHIKIDYVCLGNHEFDFGYEVLQQRMSESSATWLGSNVKDIKAGGLAQGIFDYKIITLQAQPLLSKSQNHSSAPPVPITIGIFGVCTEQTPQLSYPGDDIKFESVLEHTRRLTRFLKQEKQVDVVIALTHVNVPEDEMLVREVPGIDVIIGGHDHFPFASYQDGVLLLKCGQNCEFMGVVDIQVDLQIPTEKDPSDGHLRDITLTPSWNFTAVKGYELDGKIVTILKEHEEAMREQRGQRDLALARIVGLKPGEVVSTKTDVMRKRESAFGNMVADAIQFHFAKEGCEGAIINGGYIRRDFEYGPEAVITGSDLDLEMPFTKSGQVLEMLGKDLREALEFMVSAYPFPAGFFPHLSHGFSLKFDPELPPMKRILELRLNGEDIMDERRYKIGLSYFMAIGGDGNVAFTRGTLLVEESVSIVDMTMEFLLCHKEMEGRIQKRITMKDK